MHSMEIQRTHLRLQELYQSDIKIQFLLALRLQKKTKQKKTKNQTKTKQKPTTIFLYM